MTLSLPSHLKNHARVKKIILERSQIRTMRLYQPHYTIDNLKTEMSSTLLSKCAVEILSIYFSRKIGIEYKRRPDRSLGARVWGVRD
mgnify:CR=1 FL=1